MSVIVVYHTLKETQISLHNNLKIFENWCCNNCLVLIIKNFAADHNQQVPNDQRLYLAKVCGALQRTFHDKWKMVFSSSWGEDFHWFCLLRFPVVSESLLSFHSYYLALAHGCRRRPEVRQLRSNSEHSHFYLLMFLCNLRVVKLRGDSRFFDLYSEENESHK